MERRDFLLGTAAVGATASLLAPLAVHAAEPAAGNTASGAAMRELLQTLGELQSRFISPEFGISSAADNAEGQRFLMHLLNTALTFWLEADPERPVFTPYVTPTRKLLGDNPDAIYYFAPVRGDRSYRIRGNIAGATFTSFTVEGGAAGGQAAASSIAAMDDSELEIDPDGNFEIIASPNRPTRGNWLKLDANAGQLTTRHYFESRNCIVTQPGFRVPLEIEAIDPPPLPPAADDAEIARRIGDVNRYVRSMTMITVGGFVAAEKRPGWFSTTPNRFTTPGQWRSETGYGNLHAWYAAAPFVLMPDQALLIEGEMPQCRFANIVLWNRYMQTFDYTRRQVSLNRTQMHLDKGGSYRLVLAHRDPGVPNWLDTEGRTSGIMYWRFLLPTTAIAAPRATVVEFDEIANA
jgi:hypothetical protein